MVGSMGLQHELIPLSLLRCEKQSLNAMMTFPLVMVGGDTAGTEPPLLADMMPRPRCARVLRPHGHGCTRTVRGIGAAPLTIRPRRAARWLGIALAAACSIGLIALWGCPRGRGGLRPEIPGVV